MTLIDVLLNALHNHNHNLTKADSLVKLFLNEHNITENDLIDGCFFLTQRDYYRRVILDVQRQLSEAHDQTWGEDDDDV